jgi:hypothetical protein
MAGPGSRRTVRAPAWPGAAGCGASACKPRWQGHTGNDITSSAAVAGGLALVGSADHLLYAFAAAGCGKPVCQPKAFTQLGPDQSYQGASIAVAGGKVMLNSTDNTGAPTSPPEATCTCSPCP